MPKESRKRAFVLVLFAVPGLLSSNSRAGQTDKQGFDFSEYDSVLKAFVDDSAMVNYTKLKARPQRLNTFITDMGNLSPGGYDKRSDKDKIAFWLNAYNALTLKAIIDNYPIKSSFFRSRVWPRNSIRQIAGVWDKTTFKVMGKSLTLEHIEHKILRVKFDEPRIHIAMVCAAMGCPPLRSESYVGEKLNGQLDDQTRRFLADSAKFKIDRGGKTLYLSPIFEWFADDFVKKYGPAKDIGKHNRKVSSVLNFVALYLSDTNKKYVLAGKFKVKYLKYDWSLNEQRAGK